MSKHAMALGATVGMLALAAPALAASSPAAQTVTATGTARVRVTPTNRHSNASIVAAVTAARRGGVVGAIADAKSYAELYAGAAGLTLGPVLAITDVPASPFGLIGPGNGLGPFGVNTYCGTVHQPVFKVVDGRRRVVSTKKVHRCIVPSYETTELTVTYSAS